MLTIFINTQIPSVQIHTPETKAPELDANSFGGFQVQRCKEEVLKLGTTELHLAVVVGPQQLVDQQKVEVFYTAAFLGPTHTEGNTRSTSSRHSSFVGCRVVF